MKLVELNAQLASVRAGRVGILTRRAGVTIQHEGCVDKETFHIDDAAPVDVALAVIEFFQPPSAAALLADAATPGRNPAVHIG
jgi:hypothetical protein